jgi:hypothetical protein
LAPTRFSFGGRHHLNDGFLVSKSIRGRSDCCQWKDHQHNDQEAFARTGARLSMGVAYAQAAQVGFNGLWLRGHPR